MAYDFRCKRCGHNEAHHIEGKPEDKIHGYRYSLGQCFKLGGYELSAADARKELACFQAEGVNDISGLLSKVATQRSQRALEYESLIGD